MLRGLYCDVLTDPEGNVLWSGGWYKNRIVRSSDLLLASLMKGEEGIRGILFWAVGEGEETWDSFSPTPQPTDTSLTNEVVRQSLGEENIVFLDSSVAHSETPTAMLEVISEFSGDVFSTGGSLRLREFGIFGGDATEEADSGFMINRVIHPRIDLDPGMTLTRRLRLVFSSGALAEQQQVTLKFGADLPVASIDGIGEEYIGDLASQDISTIGDLSEIDPLSSIGNIPPVKLREFHAKARMVLNLRLSPAPFSLLADRAVGELLLERPEALAGEVDGGFTSEMITRLQEELAVLQVGLDNEQLQRVTLGDLMHS